MQKAKADEVFMEAKARPVEAKELAEELNRRIAERPELREISMPYLAIFSAQARVETAFFPPPLSGESVEARLSRGFPALVPEDFQADSGQIRWLWEEICAITARYFPDLAPALEPISRWPGGQDDRLLSASRYYLRGEADLLAKETGFKPHLFQFVLNNTFHPFLRCYARMLAPLINIETWYKPYCPVCGGEPDFAALTKPYGARWLLCSRCDFEWPYRRLSCPFCGNDNPDQYLYVPSENGKYRLYLCDRCRRYLKVIDLRELVEEPPLPVERIITLPLDIAARQEGYGIFETFAQEEEL